MARTHLSSCDFVSSVFKPTVFVSSSNDAELLCVKNHLTFADLLKPFSSINRDVILRDNNNISHCIKNLQINFEDINKVPLQPQQIKRLQNDIVSKCFATNGTNTNTFTHAKEEINIPVMTPWFEAWRQIFIENMTPSEHEFLNHYLACVFVVSTFNNDAMDQFQRLSQQLTTMQQHSNNKFFNSKILRYYVLLHDQGQGDKNKADELFRNLKSTFSTSNCYLLAINSVSTNTLTNNDTVQNHSFNENDTQTDPWIQFLIPGGNLLSEMIVSADLEGVQRNNKITKEESLHLLHQNDPLMLFKSSIEDKDSKYSSSVYSYNAGVKYSTSYPQLNSLGNHNYNFLSNDNFLLSTLSDSNDMLRIKSDINKPHGQCLTPQDHERIKQFVYEFVSFGLIPWVETTLKQLSDQIAYKLKMTRGFFTVTRKLFGGNSTSNVKTNASATNLSSNLSGSASNLNNLASMKVVYTSEAIEMQMRRHADLAFLFQQYEVAHQTYNVLKKDFQDESAHLHYAGAMEMCALSILLQGTASQRQYPQHYIDSAITIYLSYCRNFDYATRAALLNCEALKSQGLYLQASNQYIKLTTEENDLRSALLLEQSAHFYLQIKVPMIRKYAFYMIMAGHRFSKAGQKKHTIRCYTQALPIFKNKNWILAEDHMHATISKHAYLQRQLETSMESLRHLLSKDSRQTPPLQTLHLRDFLKISNEYKESLVGSDKELLHGELIAFPIPNVDATTIKVMLGKPVKQYEDISVEARNIQFVDTDVVDPEWKELEKDILNSLPESVTKLYGEVQLSNPSCLSKSTVNSSPAISVLGEPITVQVHLENPLNIPLVLTDLYLLWQFIPDLTNTVDTFLQHTVKHKSSVGDEHVTNEVEHDSALKIQEFVVTEVQSEMCLLPKEKKPIEISLIPRVLGTVKITGLAFHLNSTSPNQIINNYSSQSVDYGLENNSYENVETFHIKVKGKLNFLISSRIIGRKITEDYRLTINVSPPMPKLKAVFSEIPKTMIVDEVMKINITFTNIGKESIKNLILAVNPHNFLTFGFDDFSHSSSHHTYQQSDDNCNIIECKLNKDIQDICRGKSRTINLGHSCQLDSGGSLTVPLWIRFTNLLCVKKFVKFLFYYEPKSVHPSFKYRLLRHKAEINLKAAMRFQGQFIRPRGTDNRSLFLNLKLENQYPREDKLIEFEIYQITSLSEQWQFDQDFFLTNADKSILVGPQQTFSICLSLKPMDLSRLKPDKPTRYFSNISFNNKSKTINSGGSPCSDFFYLQYYQNVIQSLNKEFDPMLNYSITPVSQSDDISIIIMWKVTIKYFDERKTFHEGQSHIFSSKIDSSNVSGDQRLMRHSQSISFDPGHRIGTSDFNLQPLLQYSKMVNITQKFSQILIHDFYITSKLVIPVSVSLYNSSFEHIVVRLEPQVLPDHAIIEPSPSTDVSVLKLKVNQSLPSTGMCAHVLWIGISSKQFRLDPGSCMNLDVKCVVTKPGVYEMHSLTVKAAVYSKNEELHDDLNSSVHGLTFIKQDNIYSSMLIVTQQT